MQKYSRRKRSSTHTRRLRLRTIPLLTALALLFFVCGILLTFVFHSRTAISTDSVTTTNTPVQTVVVTRSVQNDSTVTPAATQKSSDNMPQPTLTPVLTTVVATPSPTASTPQHTQLGVFPLSAGGPLPVPESVLHPTNIARVMLGSTLMSVYAGSATRNPQAGILCVLREDLTTGELHLQMYQGPQTGGALTILSVQGSVLKIANTRMQGTFDLTTNTFQW